jgi:nitrogen fixation protein FixH
MMQATRILGAFGAVLMLGGALSASGATAGQESGEYLMILSAIDDVVVVGENAFYVVVVDVSDNPVEDAEVTALLSMPSMTMPETPFRVSLVSVGKGWYRGVGRLTMAGQWDIRIDAGRSGQQRGTAQITVEATAPTDGASSTVRP